MEKSCPGQESHPPSRGNFTERLYETKVDPSARVCNDNSARAWFCSSPLGPVSRKSREHFGPEKLFVKSRPTYSVKLIFSHVVKGIKIKITAKFRGSRRLRFEDTKRTMSPEIRPKCFGTFEEQAPGPS